MEEEKGRRVLIIGRMFLVSNNQEREKKEKENRGYTDPLSRNVVQSDRDS